MAKDLTVTFHFASDLTEAEARRYITLLADREHLVVVDLKLSECVLELSKKEV